MQAAWLVACIINSTYTSAWDLKMDWGLLQRHSRFFLLRNDLVFYHWVSRLNFRWCQMNVNFILNPCQTYYVAMPINVVLRFAWIVNTVGLPLGSGALGFIAGSMEAYRRFQWNFFRLENEHLNNCGQFRAIKEIPLPFSVMDESQSRLGSRVRLPIDESERYPEQEMAPVTRRTTLKDLVSRQPSTQGTFYGRRDFESKHDDDVDGKGKPSSDGVFNRLTSLHGANDSDSEDDDEDNEVSHTEN
jgi:hypothetical protein